MGVALEADTATSATETDRDDLALGLAVLNVGCEKAAVKQLAAIEIGRASAVARLHDITLVVSRNALREIGRSGTHVRKVYLR